MSDQRILNRHHLREARWCNVARLARSLGIAVPKWCHRRRRRAIVRAILFVLYPPGAWQSAPNAWND